MVTASVGAQPANDNFINAAQIPAGSYTIQTANTGATKEPGEPNHAGAGAQHSIWYRFTAPSHGTVSLNNFNHVMAAYTGTSVNGLAFVADNWTKPDPNWWPLFRAESGQTYHIALDRFDGQQGSIHSTLTFVSAPANDDFANRVVTNGASLVISNDYQGNRFYGASREPGESTEHPWASLWWQWTAPTTGRAVMSNAVASVFVYSGTSLSNLARLNQPVSDAFDVVAGAQYIICEACPWGRASGPNYGGLFRLTVLPAPPNDDFENRAAVSGLSFVVTNSTVGATRQTNEPAHATPPARRSVWFTWTAPRTDAFVLRAERVNGTNPAPVVAVYTGTTLATLQFVAAQGGIETTAPASLVAAEGMTYQIAVADTEETPGEFRLSLNPSPIRLSTPANGAEFTVGDSISLTASVDTNVLVPDFVNYWIFPAMQMAGNSLGTGAAAPDYPLVFSATAAGLYELRAKLVAGSTNILSPPAAIFVRPENDAFARRTSLAGEAPLAACTNTWATVEPGEPALAPVAAGRSLWWSWTAPDNGIAVVNAFSVAGCQPVLAIFTGDTVTNLATQPASNSIVYQGRTIAPAPMLALSQPGAFPPSTNTLYFPVAAGVTYQIALDSRAVLGTNGLPIGPDSGAIYLGVALARYPTNDLFADALPVAGADVTMRADATLAGEEPGELDHANYSASQSVWWKWLAPADGWLTLSSASTQAIRPFAFYTGNNLSNLTRLAHNGPGSTNSGGPLVIGFAGTTAVSFPVAGGTQYRIAGDVAHPVFAVGSFPPANLNRFPRAGSVELRAELSTLRLTSPADGQRFVVGAVVGLRAEFAPGNLEGPIARVDFLAGVNGGPVTNLIASLASPPYEWNWTNAPEGEIVVRAIGYTLDNRPKPAPPLQMRVVPYLPFNDQFNNRASLGSTSASILTSNAFAGLEPGEPRLPGGLGRTLWYSWTAPSNGTVVLARDGGAFTPVLEVFGGNALMNLESITNNSYRVVFPDTNCPATLHLRETIHFEAAAGATYQIAIDGYRLTNASYARASFFSACELQTTITERSGEVAVKLTFHPRPGNDSFAGRKPLSGSALSVTNSNAGATREAGEPFHGNPGGRSLWYSWVAPFSGSVTISIDQPVFYSPPSSSGGSGGTSGGVINIGTGPPPCPTCGAAIDLNPPPPFFPVFGVYQGSTLNALAPRGAGTDVTLDAVAGQTYQIALDGNAGTFGDFVFYLTLTPVPPNDNFSARIPLTGHSLFVNGYNVAASREPGEPFHAGDTSGRTVWWSWTAPAYGTAWLTLASTNWPFPIGVYTGSSLTQLEPVASGRSQVGFFAHAGRAYQIAVGADAGRTGHVNFTLLTTPPVARFPDNIQLVSGNHRLTFHASNHQGVVLQHWSGSAWTNFAVAPVTSNTVEFIVPRSSDSDSDYRALLLVEPPPPPSIGRDAGLRADGRFQLKVRGITQQPYVLLSSSNLAAWQPLLTNVCVDAPAWFVDPQTTNQPMRFYKAMPKQ